MTNHKEIERLIQKQLDLEITEAEKLNLEQHLSQCQDCRRLYEALRSVDFDLRSLTEFFPARDFNAKVLAELGFAYRKTTSIKTRIWARLTGLMAAAWVVSLIGFLVSPLPKMLLGKTLLSVPAVVSVFEKASIVFTGLREVLMPFIKTSFNPITPVVGALASIVFVVILGTIAKKKEETCKAL